MVDCPAIDTHSVALKGSLRHQWINSYSYASIHHPPPFSSGRSTPSTLSLWIFWGFEHNPTNPPFSQKSPHLFQKRKRKKCALAFLSTFFIAYKRSWFTKWTVNISILTTVGATLLFGYAWRIETPRGLVNLTGRTSVSVISNFLCPLLLYLNALAADT